MRSHLTILYTSRCLRLKVEDDDMSRVTSITVPVFGCLLIMATSTVADDTTPKDSDEGLNKMFETFNKTCLNAGLMTKLEVLLKPNMGEAMKRCDPSILQKKVTAFVSNTKDPTISDSAYREWYENSNSRLHRTVNLKTTRSTSLQFQDSNVRSIDNNFIKGKEVLNEPVISTAKGYQTLDSK